jgi:hypothetical protein
MSAAATLGKLLTPGRIVVFFASAINATLAVLVAITVVHGQTGTLQAQEDLGVFMLIVAIGGGTAIVCLVTLVAGALLTFKKKAFGTQLLGNPVAVLGVANCIAPIVLVFSLKWLLRG